MKLINYSICTAFTALCLAFSANIAQAQTPISSVTVTVNTLSSITGASVSAATPSFCTGGNTDLTVTGGTLGTGGTPAAAWTWYADNDPATTPSASIGTGTTINVAPTNSGLQPITKTYYVRIEGGACNVTTAALPVTITINPLPTVTAPSNIVACANQSIPAITLVSTPTGGPDVTFNISGGSAVGLNDATNVTSIPAFTAANTGTAPATSTVTITPIYEGCTGTPVTFDVTVNPAPSMDLIADITNCQGKNVAQIDFTSTSGSSVTYAWTNDNADVGIAASGTTAYIPAFTAANNNTAPCGNEVANLTVTPSFANAGVTCTGTPESFAVTVRPKPNGSIAIASSEICENQALTMNFTASCGTGPFEIEIKNTAHNGTGTFINVNSGGTITIDPMMIDPGIVNTFDLITIIDQHGCANPVTP